MPGALQALEPWRWFMPSWLLVLFRVTGIFVFSPIFSSQAIPPRIKIFFAVALSLAVYPLLLATRPLEWFMPTGSLTAALDLWCRGCSISISRVSAVAERRVLRLLAGAPGDFLSVLGLDAQRPELRAGMGAVAEGLTLRTSASAPPLLPCARDLDDRTVPGTFRFGHHHFLSRSPVSGGR